jgi:hypothetical protein
MNSEIFHLKGKNLNLIFEFAVFHLGIYTLVISFSQLIEEGVCVRLEFLKSDGFSGGLKTAAGAEVFGGGSDALKFGLGPGGSGFTEA